MAKPNVYLANGLGLALGGAAGLAGYQLAQSSTTAFWSLLPPAVLMSVGMFINNSYGGFTRQVGLGTSWGSFFSLVAIPAYMIYSWIQSPQATPNQLTQSGYLPSWQPYMGSQ